MIFSSKNLTILLLVLMGLIFPNKLKAKDLQHIEINENNFFEISGFIQPDMILNLNNYLEIHKKDKEIVIFISSNGGSVEVGNVLIENLKKSKKPTICIAKTAMSMAMFILQTCNKRYVLENSQLMTHNIMLVGQSGVNLTVKQLKEQLVDMEKTDAELHKIIEKRLGISKEKLASLENPDWYLNGSDEIMKHKAADKVVTVTCSKSIKNKFTPVYQNDIFAGTKILLYYKRSCPL